MASYTPDLSSIRYLAAKFLEEVGSKIARSDSLTSLDDDVLHFDALTSYFTENDESFTREWKVIQERRKANDLLAADDEKYRPDIAFRYEELRCMVRSVIRTGILYKIDAPKTEWTPTVKATA